MERKNQYHPYVKLGEIYLVTNSNTNWMPKGTVVKVFDGAVYGEWHANRLYFVPIWEVWEGKPTQGHTGMGLTITPYIEPSWEDMAREMLG